MHFLADRSRRPSLLSRVLLALLALLPTRQLTAQTSHRSTAPITEAIQAGIRDSVFPGAVVIIGRSDTILFKRGYGHYSWHWDRRRPDPDWTLWDLASLTKVVATTSAAALLVDRGRLDLETTLHQLVPEFSGPEKDSITIAMLLHHTSGLPAWERLAANGADPDSVHATLFAIELNHPPGESPLYSDFNAIFAAMAIAKVSGQSFRQFTMDSVFAPTGMWDAVWRPSPYDQLRSAPTLMFDDSTRIVGSVNDGNAAVLGGVAGHAGVFATGADLARFAQTWLRTVRGTDSAWISPATARQFLERTEISGTRALGWDTPKQDEDGVRSLYGHCASDSTWGHTGFTGTLLWFDPEADLFVVFLTNRSLVPIRRSLAAIRDVRREVSDAARRFAGGGCEM